MYKNLAHVRKQSFSFMCYVTIQVMILHNGGDNRSRISSKKFKCCFSFYLSAIQIALSSQSLLTAYIFTEQSPSCEYVPNYVCGAR